MMLASVKFRRSKLTNAEMHDWYDWLRNRYGRQFWAQIPIGSSD